MLSTTTNILVSQNSIIIIIVHMFVHIVHIWIASFKAFVTNSTFTSLLYSILTIFTFPLTGLEPMTFSFETGKPLCRVQRRKCAKNVSWEESILQGCVGTSHKHHHSSYLKVLCQCQINWHLRRHKSLSTTKSCLFVQF